MSATNHRNGIPRWPYRKIASLEKAIAHLEPIRSRDPQQDANIQSKLGALKLAKDRIVADPASHTASLKSRRHHRRFALRVLREAAVGSDQATFSTSCLRPQPTGPTAARAKPHQKGTTDFDPFAPITSTKPPRVSHISMLGINNHSRHDAPTDLASHTWMWSPVVSQSTTPFLQTPARFLADLPQENMYLTPNMNGHVHPKQICSDAYSMPPLYTSDYLACLTYNTPVQPQSSGYQ